MSIIIITHVEDKVLNNVQVLNEENWFYEGIFRNTVQSGRD